MNDNWNIGNLVVSARVVILQFQKNKNIKLNFFILTRRIEKGKKRVVVMA